MIRYRWDRDRETLQEAVLHASFLAQMDPTPGYMLVEKCGCESGKPHTCDEYRFRELFGPLQ